MAAASSGQCSPQEEGRMKIRGSGSLRLLLRRAGDGGSSKTKAGGVCGLQQLLNLVVCLGGPRLEGFLKLGKILK